MDEESSKLLNIVTQMGNYRYQVLGQGICSSQDLFNYITDGGMKLDPDFQVLKNVYEIFGLQLHTRRPGNTNKKSRKERTQSTLTLL